MYKWLREHWSYGGQNATQAIIIGVIFRLLNMHSRFNPIFKWHDEAYDKKEKSRLEIDKEFLDKMFAISKHKYERIVSCITYIVVRLYYQGVEF